MAKRAAKKSSGKAGNARPARRPSTTRRPAKKRPRRPPIEIEPWVVERARTMGLFESAGRLSHAALHEKLSELPGGFPFEALLGIPGHEAPRKEAGHTDWHNDAHWDHERPKRPDHSDFTDHYDHHDQQRPHYDFYSDSSHVDHNDSGQHSDSHGDHTDGSGHTDSKGPHLDTGRHYDSHTDHWDAEQFPPHADGPKHHFDHTDAHYDKHCDEYVDHGDHTDAAPPRPNPGFIDA